MIAAATLPLGSMADEYLAHKGVIHDTINRFCMRFGGDREEYESQADVIFVRSYNDYEKRLGRGETPKPFHTWVSYWIWFELIDAFVKPYSRRKVKVKATGEHIDMAATADAPDWLDGLSDAARHVVLLVLETPKEVADAARLKGGSPRNMRSTIRQYLEQQKWPTSLISGTFEEISNALGA